MNEKHYRNSINKIKCFILRLKNISAYSFHDLGQKRQQMSMRENGVYFATVSRLPKIYRVLCAVAGCLYLFVTGAAEVSAAVNVYFSGTPSTQIELQQAFVAATTTQFSTKITTSAFSGAVNITVTGRKLPVPISDGTAFDHCFTYGFVFGMEAERNDDLQIIQNLADNVATEQTCGGFINNAATLKDAYEDGCETGYDVAASTIAQRSFAVPQIIVPPSPN